MWSFNKSSSNSKILSLNLLEPVIFLASNLETPPVIRGTVDITLAKSCVIQNLSLSFDGKVKTQWLKSK